MTPSRCSILTAPQHSRMMAMVWRLFSLCSSLSIIINYFLLPDLFLIWSNVFWKIILTLVLNMDFYYTTLWFLLSPIVHTNSILLSSIVSTHLPLSVSVFLSPCLTPPWGMSLFYPDLLSIPVTPSLPLSHSSYPLPSTSVWVIVPFTFLPEDPTSTHCNINTVSCDVTMTYHNVLLWTCVFVLWLYIFVCVICRSALD